MKYINNAQILLSTIFSYYTNNVKITLPTTFSFLKKGVKHGFNNRQFTTLTILTRLMTSF